MAPNIAKGALPTLPKGGGAAKYKAERDLWRRAEMVRRQAGPRDHIEVADYYGVSPQTITSYIQVVTDFPQDSRGRMSITDARDLIRYCKVHSCDRLMMARMFNGQPPSVTMTRFLANYTKRVAAAAERELGKPELHQVRCNFCQEVLGYVYSIGKPGGGICQDCTKTARELGMLP